MSKRFTLEEAQSLIPSLERLLREAVAFASDYAAAERSVQALSEHVMLMGGVVMDRQQAIEDRRRRDTLAASLRRTIEQIRDLGCEVKDLDTGLVDFPTLFRGVEVYLCWKLGEPSIGYWHGTEEGFRGRKPIDQDFLDHHEGDPAE